MQTQFETRVHHELECREVGLLQSNASHRAQSAERMTGERDSLPERERTAGKLHAFLRIRCPGATSCVREPGELGDVQTGLVHHQDVARVAVDYLNSTN